MKRAAICVGVDRVKSMSPLGQAARGARHFAEWATHQGCDVSVFVDDTAADSKPVLRRQILDAVNEIVQNGTYSQLIIYFAGHGVVTSPGVETLLLSDIALDTSEAINLFDNGALLRFGGIPHIILVSDACRTYAAERQLTIRGGNIFPPNTRATSQIQVKLDSLYATSPGLASYEDTDLTSDDTGHGIFTDCLLDILNNPPPEVIDQITQPPDTTIAVVTSSKLEPIITPTVEERALRLGINCEQFPEIRAESHLPLFLAALEHTSADSSPGPEPEPDPPPTDGTAGESDPTEYLPPQTPPGIPRGPEGPVDNDPDRRPDTDAGSWRPRRNMDDPDVAALLMPGTDASRISKQQQELRKALRLMVQGQSSSLTNSTMIVAVNGGHVEAVYAGPYLHSVTRDRIDATDLFVMESMTNSGYPESALIQLTNGTSCLISLQASMHTLIALNYRGLVLSVEHTPRYAAYEPTFEFPSIRSPRAFSAAAFERAIRGDFQFTRDTFYESLSGYGINGEESILPELNLLEAYAMAELGVFDPKRFERSLYRSKRVPFDIVMLIANEFNTRDWRVAAASTDVPAWQLGMGISYFDDSVVVPFAPQLTRGWLMLKEGNPYYREYHEYLGQHLRPSLWTTFDQLGTGMAIDVIQRGEV